MTTAPEPVQVGDTPWPAPPPGTATTTTTLHIVDAPPVTPEPAPDACGSLRPSQFPGKPGWPACDLDAGHYRAHLAAVGGYTYQWTNLRTGARP